MGRKTWQELIQSKEEKPSPKPQWSYGWSITNFDLEALMVGGSGRLWIGHAPGGSIKQIVSTHHTPTAPGRVQVKWTLFTRGTRTSNDADVLSTGLLDLQLYEVETLWVPDGDKSAVVAGYLQPLYLDLNLVSGLATSLGTMTMTVLMTGAT